MSKKSTPPAKQVSKIIEDTAATAVDKDRTQSEITDYQREREEALIKGLKDDIAARKLYAGLIFILVVFWLAAILWVVIATGSGWYKLSDTVLVALITSTTVNITGFFLIVTQYLFPKKDS